VTVVAIAIAIAIAIASCLGNEDNLKKSKTTMILSTANQSKTATA
jgi:hypothetical protein